MYKYLFLILIFDLNTVNSRFCCDHDFRIEREYCEPLASVFEFKIIDLISRSTDHVEYNVEVVRTYRGHFQIHQISILFINRHYCVPDINLYPGRNYLAITKSLKVKKFTVDSCFFDLIQYAYPKVRDNQLLCMPYDINSSINDKITYYFLSVVIFVHILFILFWS